MKNAISEDNSKVYDYYVKLDGKSVDQETFRTTYQTVFGNLVYRRPISDKQKVTGISRWERSRSKQMIVH